MLLVRISELRPKLLTNQLLVLVHDLSNHVAVIGDHVHVREEVLEVGVLLGGLLDVLVAYSALDVPGWGCDAAVSGVWASLWALSVYLERLGLK